MRESDLADVREPTMAATAQLAAGGQAGVASSATMQTSAGNADVLQSEIHALDVRLRAVRGGASAHAGGAQRIEAVTEADKADARTSKLRKPPGSTRSSRLREDMQWMRGGGGSGAPRQHLEGSKLSQKRRSTKRDLGHCSGGEARAHRNPNGVEMGAGSAGGEHPVSVPVVGAGGDAGDAGGAGEALHWQQDSAFVDALRDFELSISALTSRHV